MIDPDFSRKLLEFIIMDLSTVRQLYPHLDLPSRVSINGSWVMGVFTFLSKTSGVMDYICNKCNDTAVIHALLLFRFRINRQPKASKKGLSQPITGRKRKHIGDRDSAY